MTKLIYVQITEHLDRGVPMHFQLVFTYFRFLCHSPAVKFETNMKRLDG